MIKVLLKKYQVHIEGVGVFSLPRGTRGGLPAPGAAWSELGQAERVDGSVTETSPEQRGSEVHTKKTVMIKTIETRDGEVSLPGPLTGGGPGVCLGSCQPAVLV